MDHVKHLVSDPLAGIGVEHLGCEVYNAVHGSLRERARGPFRNKSTDEIAVVAVENDFIADLGTIAGLDESVARRHGACSGVRA
jgi:hypothetical protein